MHISDNFFMNQTDKEKVVNTCSINSHYNLDSVCLDGGLIVRIHHLLGLEEPRSKSETEKVILNYKIVKAIIEIASLQVKVKVELLKRPSNVSSLTGAFHKYLFTCTFNIHYLLLANRKDCHED